MSRRPPLVSTLPAFAAALLVGISLPTETAFAQGKTKTKTKTPAVTEVSHEIVVPTINAEASSLSEEQIAAILQGDLATYAEDLAALDASRIAVPEITVTFTTQRRGEEYETRLHFADLVLSDVSDGVAASVSLGGVGLTNKDGMFDLGAISAANVDIGGVLGIYGLVGGSGSDALETIYTDYHAAGGVLVAEGVQCEIGAAYGAEFKARPLKTSFGEIITLAQALEAEKDRTPDPALLGQVLRMYADVLTAFETSEVTFDGMSCTGPDSKGRQMDFSIAGVAVGGMSPGIYPAISVDGFAMEVEGDGAFTLDQLTIKPTDLRQTIATLSGAPELIDEDWLEENARLLIPAAEGFAFAGLNIDIPDPDSDESRIKANIGAFDLTLGAYLNGIPTSADISGRNILVDLPEESRDAAIGQLLALGITSLDAGFRIAAAWDEATATIGIEEISLSGVDLANVSLAGTISNATADLFALDIDTAIAAGLELALKSLSLDVLDEGLVDIALSVVAAEQGGDPAALRPIFADLAKGTIISVLAEAADAAQLGDAVSNFIAGKASALQIGIVAKTDPGLSFDDLVEAGDDPTTLISKVDISAAAQ